MPDSNDLDVEQQHSKTPSGVGVKGSLIGLRPAVRFLKPYRWVMVAALVALVATALVTLSMGQGVRLIIDDGFSSGSEAQLQQAIFIFLGLVVAMAVGTFTRFYLVSWLGERVTADIRRAVFDHVVSLPPSYFERNAAGEIQSRITTDTTLLQTVIGSSVSIALRNMLMFMGGLIWLLITNPKLTAIVLVAVPLVVAPIMLFGRQVRRLSRHSQDRIADAGAYVNETLQNIKIVQAFNHEERDRERFSAHAEQAFDVAVLRIRQRSWLTAVVITLVMGAIAIMLWIGGQDVLAGRISAGELAAFVFYAVMVAVSVAAISEVIGDLQRAAGATERLMELLQTDNPISSPVQPKQWQKSVEGLISIEQLSFNYPSRPDRRAIDELSLTVTPGSHCALVGASGAGKSTLFDLLLRFYDPQQGYIALDNIPLPQLSLDALRQQIALVPQQPVLFSGTIADNIRYARPLATDEEVREAARAAYADHFIEALPDGYLSHVGESGVRLSGGQKQRIAIARAVLCDPKILLLDEATSALDAESEFQVQQALQHLMTDRTTLIIAHRLATVVHVDNIVVLEQGRIVAQGNHQHLLQHCTPYRRWAELQFDEPGASLPSSQLAKENVVSHLSNNLG